MSHLGKSEIICPGIWAEETSWTPCSDSESIILKTRKKENELLLLKLEKYHQSSSENYWKLFIKGPLGEESIFFPEHFQLSFHINKANKKLSINVMMIENLNKSTNSKKDKNKSLSQKYGPKKKYWGTLRQNIHNSILGVTQGYKTLLTLKGVGYRAWLEDEELCMNIGLSHQVRIKRPKDIKIRIKSTTEIILEGINKEKLNTWANKVRLIKPSHKDVYKQAGISMKYPASE